MSAAGDKTVADSKSGGTKAARDFGSFHASNVEDLIALPDVSYVPPPCPVDLPACPKTAVSVSEPLPQGTNARAQFFHLEPGCTFLNHGAFGGVLKPALAAAQAWQTYVERQPLRFYDRVLLPQLVHVIRRLAAFVGCPPANLVLLPNVTTAINTVMRSVGLRKGDAVYCLSVEYGATKKIIRQTCEEAGASVCEQQVTFPLQTEDEIVDLVEKTLPAGAKLAVFDHVPSNTPFVLPITRLARVCHDRDVLVCVDAAHALGQLPHAREIATLDVDFYAFNCHKWFSAPKGCAAMYVASEQRSRVRPLVVSHGYDSGFTSQFIWTGLQDYSPYLALHTVIDFWQKLGYDRVCERNERLADDIGDMLVKKWQSGLLVAPAMSAAMFCVRLPRKLYESLDEPVQYRHAEIVQNALYDQYNIEVPVKAVQNELYVRLSVHLYNHMEEYQRLGTAVLELTDQRILS